ncbi:amidase family protein [Nocardioides houyundeii]|uniref:amidase family protein n=1 Tax=Nocardioides houyundeii TaxID=2045452 RepID=UPI000C788007|nr:amidase [Nocardioides houyundeii]
MIFRGSRPPAPPVPRPWTGNARDHLTEASRLLAEREPWLRAFTHVEPPVLEAAIHPGAGPLAGMPIAVKEIIDVAGMPVGLGSSLFADRVPTGDAEAVARLRAAGARVLGITTSTPFACGTTTVTANPQRRSHTPGGSSAGSAAAVGAGIVPVALASQSQASTLRPASYCGVWGFKPTHLRLPRGGMHLLADTLDDLGVIAASLGDLERVLPVLADWRPTGAPQGLRIGRLHLDDGGLTHPATVAGVDRLVRSLDGVAGIDLVDQDPLRAFDQAVRGSGRSCFDIFAAESAPTLAGYVAAGERDPRLGEMVSHAAGIGASGLAQALAVRSRLQRQYADLAEHVDLMIAPATTAPAPPGLASTGCRRMPATSSLLGVPALSAPWLSVEDLPQGVQLLGFAGRDEELLAAARLLHDTLTAQSPTRSARQHLQESR